MALETVSGKRLGSKFLKAGVVFANPGDKFAGIYRDAKPGKFGLDVTFETERGHVVLTIKQAVQEDLEAAGTGDGDLVVLTFLEAVKSKKFPHPWKKFKVEIDQDFSGPPPANEDNVWAS